MVILANGHETLNGPVRRGKGLSIRKGDSMGYTWLLCRRGEANFRMPLSFKRKLAAGAGNLLLVLLSAGFALLVGEAFLRYSYYQTLMPSDGDRSDFVLEQHPTRGFALMPNRNVRVYNLNWSLAVTTNSKGLRDGEIRYERDPGVARILVLGDSFMDGYQVNLSEGLPALLEGNRQGKKTETVNLGVRGYGTLQELLYLKEEGLKYKPDIVLLAFYPLNDFYDNHRELSRLMWGGDYWQHTARPYGDIDDSGVLCISPPDAAAAALSLEAQREKQKQYTDWLASRVWYKRTAIFQTYERAQKTRGMHPTVYDYNPNVHLGAILKSYDPGLSPDAGISADTYARLWSEAFDVTELAIAEIARVCKEAGIRLVVFAVPAKEQVDTDTYLTLVKLKYPALEFDLEKPNRWLRDVTKRHGIEFCDLLPGFRKQHNANCGPLYHEFDSHWNAAGHRLASTILSEFLARNHVTVEANSVSAFYVPDVITTGY